MDFGAILTGNLDIVLTGIIGVFLFFAFFWIPLKLFWKWVTQ